MMSEKKRLHPVSVIFNIIQIIKDWFLGSVGVVIVLAIQDSEWLIIAIGMAVLLVVALSISILRWFRFTYVVDGDELRVEYGVIIRKKRYISRQRIQSIDLTQSVIHRLFNLARVEIETAGSGSDKEASLKAVAYAEGVLIRQRLKYGVFSGQDNEPEPDNGDEDNSQAGSEIHARRQITFKHLFIAGTTSGSIGVLTAILGVAFTQVDQFIPEHIYDEAWSWIVGQSLSFLAALALFVAIPLWILSILGTMIKYGHFTITRQENELFITRGLLEKKQLTIPLRKIQAIGFQQSLLRQPFSYGSIFVEIAGGSIDEARDISAVLFPFIKKHDVNAFLENFLPEIDKMPNGPSSIPGRSLIYYLVRALIPVVIGAILVWIFVPAFLWVIGAIAVVAFLLGFMRHQDTATLQRGPWLHVTTRGFALTRMVIPHRRVQAFEIKQHPIHKRQNLATMKVSIMGSVETGTHYKVKEIDVTEARRLADWYRQRLGEGRDADS